MNVIVLLLGWIIHLYVFVILLRLICQWAGLPFTNQYMQLLYHLTRTWSAPLRSVLPMLFGIDLSLLFVAFLLLVIKNSLNMLLGVPFSLAFLLLALVEGATIVINIFFFSIIINIIISFLVPGLYHPVLQVIRYLTEPILNPVRRAIPPVSGFDLSPIVVLLGLKALEMILVSVLL